MVIYFPDNSKSPVGIGKIDIGPQIILIQSNDICPSVPEGKYNDIITIENKEVSKSLVKTLKEHSVIYVYDPLTAKNFNIDDPLIGLADWIQLTFS